MSVIFNCACKAVFTNKEQFIVYVKFLINLCHSRYEIVL